MFVTLALRQLENSIQMQGTLNFRNLQLWMLVSPPLFLGSVHTTPDGFCIGMKIIPYRGSVHTQEW